MGFFDSLSSFAGPIGSLVNGVSSIISTSMSNKQAIKNQREAQEWSEGMNAQQQEWQEKMWNLNNSYNSPASQVQRLREAGINPNSALGGMSQAATSSMPQQPSIPSPNAAQVFPYDLDFLGAALNTAEQANRDKLAQSQNKLQEAQARLAGAEADKVVEDMIDVITMRPSKKAALDAEAYRNWQEADYYYYSSDVMRWTAYYLPQKTRLELDKIRSEIQKNMVESAKTKAEADAIEFTNKHILPLQAIAKNSEIRAILASAAAQYAQALLANKQAQNAVKTGALLDQQIEGGQSDLDVKKLLNDILQGEVKKYGAPINQLPIDEMNSLIMHLGMVMDPDRVASFLDNYFDTFDGNAGAYFRMNIQKQLSRGQFKTNELYNSGRQAAGEGSGRNRFSKGSSAKFGNSSSPSHFNPTGGFKRDYDLR